MKLLPLRLLCILFAALWVAGCEELPSGMLAPQADVPEGHLAYVTRDGDRLYSIADKFYGRGWMMVQIEDANQSILPFITNENGSLQGGHVIYLPPNLDGVPLK